MALIVNTYRQSVGAMRFIGKKYTNNDRVDGHFGAKWDEWRDNNLFDLIEAQITGNLTDTCEDGDAHIGLMREENGNFENFEYWVGLFTPEQTPVPEGFEYVDFPKSELGVCWIYGKEEDVFMLEGKCGEKLQKEGFEITGDWCFERYACPRFTEPDAKGNIIIDICFYVK
ncbi:MAG: GyrI-like domain-containing protein [Oscillospiraceae bacterium]|nr:GyrI-like domain-containing protein [Oscillospiraceae bacterium]